MELVAGILVGNGLDPLPIFILKYLDGDSGWIIRAHAVYMTGPFEG